MSANIVCPSGLAGEIRGLKGKEGKVLANQKAARAGATFERILAGCWLHTTEPGLYTLDDNGTLDWSKVLVADRFYTLLRIRALTFGPEYAFAVQCASAGCRERFEWTLNLDDLPVKPLSDAAKAVFKAGNRHETQLADGRRVWFKLMTGADEVRAANIRRNRRDDELYTALLVRILDIDGVAPNEKDAFLDEMELGDMAALLDRFDTADGGVETTIEVECPACLHVQDIRLPFAAGFFLPKGKPTQTSRMA